MENNLDSIYIKNLLLSFWRGGSDDWDSFIVIGTYLCIFPFIFIFAIIDDYFFTGYFFTYPDFLDQVFFIFCLEIFVLFVHLIFSYFDSTNYAKKSVVKEDGSRHFVYFDESISWIDLIKEFVAVSIVYILVLWIFWLLVIGIY
jgi:hypothetical protein